MAGCRRRPKSNAERTVLRDLEAELARCEEVFRIVVTALALPFIVNAFVPVPVRPEDARGAMKARDEGRYVFVGVHDHAERLSVFDVELPVHERICRGQLVDRPATDQWTKPEVGRLGEPFDRIPNPDRVGVVFEPELAGERDASKLVSPTGQWFEAAQVVDTFRLDRVAPVVAVQGEPFIADIRPTPRPRRPCSAARRPPARGP